MRVRSWRANETGRKDCRPQRSGTGLHATAARQHLEACTRSILETERRRAGQFGDGAGVKESMNLDHQVMPDAECEVLDSTEVKGGSRQPSSRGIAVTGDTSMEVGIRLDGGGVGPLPGSYQGPPACGRAAGSGCTAGTRTPRQRRRCPAPHRIAHAGVLGAKRACFRRPEAAITLALLGWYAIRSGPRGSQVEGLRAEACREQADCDHLDRRVAGEVGSRETVGQHVLSIELTWRPKRP